jgi:hypothetical protein
MIHILLQAYPGYTASTLLQEDAEAVLRLLHITSKIAEANRPKK